MTLVGDDERGFTSILPADEWVWLRKFISKGQIGKCFQGEKGFGFVTFAEASSVEKVLSQAIHELDGKKSLAAGTIAGERPAAFIDPKVAFPRRAHPKEIRQPSWHHFSAPDRCPRTPIFTRSPLSLATPSFVTLIYLPPKLSHLLISS
ncbi:unnamed protein product [Bemisia tabaci]|uniref:RRM domain-containing protein n=1 Tax=Bemisia tabaci TaxID=7038 RepID=A0A9P0A0Z7_BEMTA|nr:unnamed protein product [Bemisia tabaci]